VDSSYDQMKTALGVEATFYASFYSLHNRTNVHKVKLNCSTSAPGRRLLPVERSW
jgi:hypothetical protein